MEAQYGQQIRKMRKAYKLTQVELANKANISISSLQRYETNERQPTIDILEKIASVFDMSLGSFLWASPEKDKVIIPIVRQTDTSSDKPNIWFTDLQHTIENAGYRLTFEGDILQVYYPDGILNVSVNDLMELRDSINNCVELELYRFKMKNMQNFKPNKDKP